MRREVAVVSLLVGCVVAPGDDDPADTDTDPAAVCVERTIPVDVHPRMVVGADQKEALLARAAIPPLDKVLASIEATAALSPVDYDPAHWDANVHGANAQIAMSAALLGWLRDDAALLAKATALLVDLPENYETNTDWDINIRMVHPLAGYATAWDFVAASGTASDDDLAKARATLLSITGKFYAQYLLDDATRGSVLGPAQNNHPIRTAAGIGYVALLFADAPDAPAWLDWAASEIAYLLGPDGKYVQPDGGVSEGPFYYSFGYTAAMPFLVAMERAHPADRCLHTDCRNRSPLDPWFVTDCVDGEPFVFPDLPGSQLLLDSLAWSVSLRLPNGFRNALADAHHRTMNGSVLLTAWHDAPWLAWDFQNPGEGELAAMTWGMDLRPWHLALIDTDQAPVEPPWTDRFFPEAGHAILRTGWGRDDLWAMLVAEAGAARKTLHDHVDGLHVTVAAFGELLLMDTGYHKASSFNLPETSPAVSHNVILVDGVGAPPKGLLTDFGDTDAFLEHTLDAGWYAGAEARQSYEGHTFVRSLAMVRDRYLVVADRLEADAPGTHTYRWRAHPYAGGDTSGTLEVEGDTLTVARGEARLRVRLASTAQGLVWEEVERTGTHVAPHVHDVDEVDGLGHHAVWDGVVSGEAPGFLAVLVPWKQGGSAPEVREEPMEEGGVAWRVDEDLVFLRGPGAPGTFTTHDGIEVETDAAWGVVGLADGAVYLARGTFVEVDGVRTEVDAAAGVGAVAP